MNHKYYRNSWQVLIFGLGILINGCDSNNPIDEYDPEAPPIIITEPSEIDINEDNSPDLKFEIEFIGTTDEPMSAISMTLSINPFENFLLYKNGEGNIPFSYGEIIQENMDSLFSWSSFNAGIIGKDWHINQGWDIEWSGVWSGITNKYLPFALSVNDSLFYGWFEISVNTTYDSAYVQVVDYNFNTITGLSILAGE